MIMRFFWVSWKEPENIDDEKKYKIASYVNECGVDNVCEIILKRDTKIEKIAAMSAALGVAASIFFSYFEREINKDVFSVIAIIAVAVGLWGCIQLPLSYLSYFESRNRLKNWLLGIQNSCTD